MKRKSNARWQGTAKEGAGTLTTQSGVLNETPYSFVARFGDGKGTNPEELIAAAHATCVSMALANGLAQDGHAPRRLETDAVCTLDQTDAGFRIVAMHLTVRGEVEGVDEAGFEQAAQTAKEGCPVSNALGGVEITMEASLA